jgi:hypothetical protein
MGVQTSSEIARGKKIVAHDIAQQINAPGRIRLALAAAGC